VPALDRCTVAPDDPGRLDVLRDSAAAPDREQAAQPGDQAPLSAVKVGSAARTRPRLHGGAWITALSSLGRGGRGDQ
jgi:hypothetical protein